MKRITAFILGFALLAQTVALAAPADTADCAEAVFGKKDVLTNITATSSAKSALYQGEYARLLSNGSTSGNLYLKCNVSDKFLFDLDDNTPIDITVGYFDDASGHFTIQYDSNNPQTGLYSGNQYYRQAEVVKLEGTKEWRTHTFHLEDMKMANRIDSGNDFRIAMFSYTGEKYSASPIAFNFIKVEKAAFTNVTKVSVTSDKLGNIFSAEDKQIKLNLDFLNKADETAVSEYTAKIYDKLSGESVYETSGKNEIDGKTVKTDTITFDNPGRNSIYAVEIEETTWLKSDISSKKTRTVNNEFSISVKLKKHEGDPAFAYQTQVISLDRGYWDEVSQLQSEVGCSWNRDGIAWKTVEKEKGKYELPEGVYDKLVGEKENGIENVIICSNYNDLYDGGKTPHTDEGIQAYANYCGFLAGALKGVTDHFEIWNEYNHTPFNNLGTGPDVYAKMLKAAYTEIKKANPDAFVIGLDTANVDLRFAEEVFKEGGLDYCDAVSVHPYDWAGGFDEDIALNSLLELRKIMNKYGHDKPIWATEVGFSTLDGAQPSKPAYPGYTQTEQAAAIVLQNSLFKAHDACDMMVGYCLYDRNNQIDIEACWGLLYYWLDVEGSKPRNGAKESYLATAAMNRFIGGYNAEYKDIIEGERFYAVNFFNNKLNNNVLVVESGYGEKQMTLSLGCPSIDLYDMYGNKTDTLYSDDGNYSFVLSKIPYYAVGNFTKFEESGAKPLIEADAVVKTAAENDIVKFSLNTSSKKTMKIDVQTDDGISVAENNGFSDGKAEIVLKTDTGILGGKGVHIKVYDENGRTYYTAEHKVNVEEPILTSINFEQAIEGRNDHWRAVIKVTNTSNSAEINGSVQLLEPQSIAVSAPNKRFKHLKPGETATMLYNMPTQITQKPIKLTAEVKLSEGFNKTISKNMEVTMAAYAEKKPVIDGVISENEWSNAWFGADDESNVRVLLKPWRGTSDLSFSGTMMWDEDYLYFLAVVTDDVHCVNYTPQSPYYMYKGDGIQFGIDERTEVAAGGETKFNEIGIADIHGMGGTVFRYDTVYGLADDAVVENCETAVTRHSTYTLYETKIPWSQIFYEGFKAEANSVYSFSALVNDNDGGGRNGWIEYGQGIGSGRSVAKFGRLTLVK